MRKNRTLSDSDEIRFLPRREWLQFGPGDQVVLEFHDGYKTDGFVSDVMPDATAIWVHLAGGGERRLFCPADQIHISKA